MKLKDWFKLQKEDIDSKIRSYSKFRALLIISIVFSFFVSIFWIWQKTLSPKVSIFDQTILSIIGSIRTPFLVNFFSVVTTLGNFYFVAGLFALLAIILFLNHRKRAAAVAIFSLLGSGLFILLLKELFDRQRPFGCISGNDCLSFPSGHTTLASYTYGLLDYLIFRFLPISLKTFVFLNSIIALVVLLIAFSRVFLFVHYPSDILAGFFLGGAWLLLSILLIDILYKE